MRYLLVILFLLITPWPSYAAPNNRILNPVTDISWNSIFPIKIGGVTVVPSDQPDAPDLNKMPICACPAPPPIFVRPGIPISFWEPARLIETVKDPFFFPSIGSAIPIKSTNGGTSADSSIDGTDSSSFQQAHYFIFPVWALLELLTDFACVESGGFDLAYITEVDPLWNNDILAFILNPEAALFANPVAQLSCIPDSVASNLYLPLSPFFWCMGSWGSAYPLTGHVNNDNYLEANAAIAARMIFRQGRLLLLQDTGINLCAAVPTPIWVKHNYRLQLAMPVRNISAFPIGQSGLRWGGFKNPPFVGDNFVWAIFRKRACCAS
ncbi:MAG: TraU family protein [Deltaproteobacteria bacterium]|nr:TraU family protein [Deltaproteobacteria bacterium]